MTPQTPALSLPPPAFAPVGLSVSAEQKLELLEYWRSITKRKWLILALSLVVALVAAVIAYALTPMYSSTATVLIEGSKGKILSIEDIYAGNQQREHYQTQVEIMKSREVAERTVKALKLWEHPAFDPRQATPSLKDRTLAALGTGTALRTWTEEALQAHAVGQLMRNLTVQPVRLSQLVRVSVAIQAGRELRVMVESEHVSDGEADTISMSIADRIQNEMTYPGQVKIVVIREKRSMAVAK